MSFTLNQNIPPCLDPNCPTGPTGPIGPSNCTGANGPTGCTGTNGSIGCVGSPGPTGATGATGVSLPAGSSINITLPVGQSITIPYTSSGWFYGINIILPPTEKKVLKIKDDRDGCDCVKCKSFYPFAEPNQEDGTLICFSCRSTF